MAGSAPASCFNLNLHFHVTLYTYSNFTLLKACKAYEWCLIALLGICFRISLLPILCLSYYLFFGTTLSTYRHCGVMISCFLLGSHTNRVCSWYERNSFSSFAAYCFVRFGGLSVANVNQINQSILYHPHFFERTIFLLTW